MGLIAITANRDSAIGREADVCLTLPKAREACPNGLAPTTSTTMQLALGDALMVRPLARSLGLPETAARDRAEQLLVSSLQRANEPT